MEDIQEELKQLLYKVRALIPIIIVKLTSKVKAEKKFKSCELENSFIIVESRRLARRTYISHNVIIADNLDISRPTAHLILNACIECNKKQDLATYANCGKHNLANYRGYSCNSKCKIKEICEETDVHKRPIKYKQQNLHMQRSIEQNLRTLSISINILATILGLPKPFIAQVKKFE